MMILDSIDKLKLNQLSYLDLINELELAKQKALIKLKKEDKNVKAFVESNLYMILKSNIMSDKNKYELYLKSIDDYNKVVIKEVFDILIKEGKK